MGYTNIKDFFQSRGGLAVGVLFILATGFFMAPQAAVTSLFPYLFNAMPIAVPAVLLSLWLSSDKSFPIKDRMKAGAGFFVILLMASLLYAVADIMIYKAGVGVIFTSYLALFLLCLTFVGISALAFILFKNPALKTLFALFVCCLFYYFTKGDFIALSSGMLGITDAVYLLSFVFLVIGATFILSAQKTIVTKVMQMICVIIILVSANLIVKPLDATVYLDFSMGEQFSVRDEDQAHLSALTKPVKVTLFLPKSIIAENHDTKAFSKMVRRYLNCLSKYGHGLIAFEDMAGVPFDGDFAIIITDNDGKEDYVFLPGKNTVKNTQRTLLQKLLKAGGVPEVLIPGEEKDKPIKIADQSKASLVWNITSGIYFSIALLWLVLFIFYERRNKKGKK